ncbi:MAG: hypothetical protein EOO65_00720 [Methanosarcinales archaeon]|nr:MAG: hypothetical protein EOO65_00720 [Methanosarcinales archaeon]
MGCAGLWVLHSMSGDIYHKRTNNSAESYFHVLKYALGKGRKFSSAADALTALLGSEFTGEARGQRPPSGHLLSMQQDMYHLERTALKNMHHPSLSNMMKRVGELFRSGCFDASVMQIVHEDALLCRMGIYTVCPLQGMCTCPTRVHVCKHIIVARMLVEVWFADRTYVWPDEAVTVCLIARWWTLTKEIIRNKITAYADGGPVLLHERQHIVHEYFRCRNMIGAGLLHPLVPDGNALPAADIAPQPLAPAAAAVAADLVHEPGVHEAAQPVLEQLFPDQDAELSAESEADSDADVGAGAGHDVPPPPDDDAPPAPNVGGVVGDWMVPDLELVDARGMRAVDLDMEEGAGVEAEAHLIRVPAVDAQLPAVHDDDDEPPYDWETVAQHELRALLEPRLRDPRAFGVVAAEAAAVAEAAELEDVAMIRPDALELVDDHNDGHEEHGADVDDGGYAEDFYLPADDAPLAAQDADQDVVEDEAVHAAAAAAAAEPRHENVAQTMYMALHGVPIDEMALAVRSLLRHLPLHVRQAVVAQDVEPAEPQPAEIQPRLAHLPLHAPARVAAEGEAVLRADANQMQQRAVHDVPAAAPPAHRAHHGADVLDAAAAVDEAAAPNPRLAIAPAPNPIGVAVDQQRAPRALPPAQGRVRAFGAPRLLAAQVRRAPPPPPPAVPLRVHDPAQSERLRNALAVLHRACENPVSAGQQRMRVRKGTRRAALPPAAKASEGAPAPRPGSFEARLREANAATGQARNRLRNALGLGRTGRLPLVSSEDASFDFSPSADAAHAFNDDHDDDVDDIDMPAMQRRMERRARTTPRAAQRVRMVSALSRVYPPMHSLFSRCSLAHPPHHTPHTCAEASCKTC